MSNCSARMRGILPKFQLYDDEFDFSCDFGDLVERDARRRRRASTASGYVRHADDRRCQVFVVVDHRGAVQFGAELSERSRTCQDLFNECTNKQEGKKKFLARARD